MLGHVLPDDGAEILSQPVMCWSQWLNIQEFCEEVVKPLVTWNRWCGAYLHWSNWNTVQVKLPHSRSDLWEHHWLSTQDSQPCWWSNRLNSIQCHFHITSPKIKDPLEEFRDEVNVNFVFHFDINTNLYLLSWHSLKTKLFWNFLFFHLNLW